ncbi:hypothetical protein [Candidatus Sulfurimonas baltica]|uniref:Uncharacterized protein n=1 Tax=Candidatus Sulfurimonas baltica TaxID=2740404 RepID=A0A7S7LWT1_9BACT|nr:hypothetical protein [Candidatus Sulfurimonas baltica]QOY52024.1 hypothetical protein HUE88_13210 [Candidatus Sulfurimonas baltica]
MKLFLRSVIVTAILVNLLLGSDNIQYSKKYQTHAESSIMSFILLNHSRLIHEIEFGEGDYVESLIAQKPIMNFLILHKLASSTKDTYYFAKAVVEYR